MQIHEEHHIRRGGVVYIVTYCKGRLHQLRQMLPMAMQQELPPGYCLGGAVVVDFGCPENCGSWALDYMEPLHRPRQVIGVVTVTDDTEYFQLCRARNVGCVEAFRLGADFVFLMDCDLLLHDKDCIAAYIREFERITDDDHRTGVVATGTKVWDPVKGQIVDGLISACLIQRGAFFLLKGYDESHTGYGHDDTNFFKRAKIFVPFGVSPLNYEHMLFDPELRDQYLTAPRSQQEIERTAAWCDDLERPVNPKGYGKYSGFFTQKEPR